MDDVLEVAELEEPLEAPETPDEPETEQTDADPPPAGDVAKDPYSTQAAREMRAALRALATQHPEQAKVLRQARDNHERLVSLSQLEPKGIDGVREKYALLDSLTHGDAKGTDAVTAMRDELATVQETDRKVAAGDVTALEAFGEEFNAGLTKLAPAILDRILRSDPAAHESIMLPQHVKFLAGSPLVKHFNDLVDVLEARDDPRFDDKTKAAFTRTQLIKMGGWLNELQQKAGEVKPGPVASGNADPVMERQSALDKQEQDFHWNSKIQPLAKSHEASTFNSLFEPYQKRLKLDATAKEDMMQAFKAAMYKAGISDPDYQRQMKLYRAQKNPDPAVVANYVKNAINKHSKPAMEQLVKARYGAFLNGKPKAPVTAGANGKPLPPPGPDVQIVSVKPDMKDIDHRKTPIDWLAKKQYRLYSGKVVQVRPQ